MTHYVCIFPVVPHWDWMSRPRDQLRICKKTKYANQGPQKFITPRTFLKVHIHFKLIQCQWLVFFLSSLASFWRLVLVGLPGAGIKDVGITLPDGARRTPASRILIPDTGSQRLQSWYIVIAWAARWPEASLRRGSVACCQPIVWSRGWLAQGATCWLPLSARTAVLAIKDA